MRVLIVGCGYVGLPLGHELVRQGFKVFGLRRSAGGDDELKAAGAEVNSLRLGEQTIAKTVCRHAVKANDPLQGRELENLVNDLRHCVMPYTCPHGRPTLIEMNFRELEKKFGRVTG